MCAMGLTMGVAIGAAIEAIGAIGIPMPMAMDIAALSLTMLLS